MNRSEAMELCRKYFEDLAEKLKDTHVVVGSCNKDSSVYLVPKGTEDQITYYGKPEDSYRISDHWNWFSSLKKCTKEHYMQCFNVGMPWSRRRPEPGKASTPIFGIQVAYYGKDHKYHAVYGYVFDRKTKKWRWKGEEMNEPEKEETEQ